MPPKRHKFDEPASAPELKKRATRSSAKSDTAATQDPTLESPKAERKIAKSKSKPRSKELVQKSVKPGAAERSDDPSPADNAAAPRNVTTLTITSDLVKKPIHCHKYITTKDTSDLSSGLIFTHGAGGTLSTPAVVNFCVGFSTSLPVLAFQGSMHLKSRMNAFHACVEHLKSEATETGLKNKGNALETRSLLGGRSMGARAAVIAATEIVHEKKSESHRQTAAQLILVSYPLKGPKDDIRDQILLKLPKFVDVLFIIGDKDSMCPLDLLNDTRGKMSAKSQLIVVRGADHGMHVKPAKLENGIGEETGSLAAEWVNGRMEKELVYIGE
ncbi:hypothetical protein EJ02DRAFT_449999 [Clathrospora elynae]|uniref:KANL3/Tex30 alpha/beta hydrolase-like domain-containing protein n=1 Tax=Clathrospora elynae TaxID=706981 RepID=A0A6A5T315_9PLEO|nr:hypothetical protein EJ02DRAFT_449999 [Clathrospora elynae]